VKTLIHVVAASVLITPLVARPAGAADLASAKTLYASASYEEALAELGKIPVESWDEHVDEYRALCLLALGRTREAEQALEHLVRLRPLYSVPSDQMSPRVVQLFETVRWRTVPAVAREMYTNAKGAFDAGRVDDAVALFRQLGQLLSDATLIEQTPNLADIKELGDGFLKLAQARLPPPAPAAPAAPPPAPAAPAAAVEAQIFTPDDADVTAPVEIERRMPRWVVPSSARAAEPVRGVLEVVSDATGTIESVKVVRPMSPTYDRELVATSRQWKFRPAMKDGMPVRYRWLMEIVLTGR
jgi:TonB family protein